MFFWNSMLSVNIFLNEDDIDVLTQKLKEFIANKPVLHKRLKEVLWQKEYSTSENLDIHK